MDESETLAAEGRLRKVILKAGALAGFTAVATMAALASLFWLARWEWTQIQEDAESRHQMAIYEQNAKVHPDFLASARKVGDLIRSEHADSLKGWKIFKPSHERSEGAVDQLMGSAMTPHERSIAQDLRNHESLFSICVKGVIGMSYPIGTLSHCETQSPVSEIDQALK